MIINPSFIPDNIYASPALLEALKINDFTETEIETTNASLESVKMNTLIAVQCFRNIINVPFFLVENGLTTGDHQSETHPRGEAIDGFIDPKVDVDAKFFKKCYYAAIDSGFRGIGSYYNKETNITGFHLDIGLRIRRWKAVKLKRGMNWLYKEFSCNHKEL